MTKRRLSEMEVVEVDAIDLGDWEHNMSTSEVPAAHLARMVRQTKAAPVVRPDEVPVVDKPRSEMARPQPQNAPDVATVVARPTAPAARSTSPDVGYVAARPSVAPSTITPASEALPAPADRELAPAKLRPRFASPRVLLLAGGAVAAVILVVVLALHGSGSTAEPVVAQAAPPTSTSPSATPLPSAATTTSPVATTSKSPAVARAADTATTPKPETPSRAIAADVRKPSSKPETPATPATKHHSHASHHHSAHKTVAARSAPHVESPVDTGTVDRAREAYNAGNEALFAGNFDDAIRSYKEAVDVSPSHAFGYRGLGLAYTQKGDSAAAVAAFKEYLRLAPHAKDSALIRKRISGLQSAHH
jgi:Flp pilus assembly protein TadD